jgi:type IV pilus assembly protein PilV
MRSGSRPGRPRHGGFTMLEVLVAVLILSIGLLGLAGIYVASVQNTKTANLRTLATQQAYDLADRMRTNIGALTVLSPTVPFYHLPTATQHTSCYTATCTSQQMAENDYYEWNDPASPGSNRSVLPDGNGVVCLDSTPSDGTWDGAALTHACDGLGTAYAIKIWWLEKAATEIQGPTYQRFVFAFQPQP